MTELYFQQFELISQKYKIEFDDLIRMYNNHRHQTQQKNLISFELYYIKPKYNPRRKV
jgi:hypothetical protein